MAYYIDFSPYEYIKSKAKSKVYNIGWLGKGHIFMKGKIDEFMLDLIFGFCKDPVSST